MKNVFTALFRARDKLQDIAIKETTREILPGEGREQPGFLSGQIRLF